jgi:hypothetical protein
LRRTELLDFINSQNFDDIDDIGDIESSESIKDVEEPKEFKESIPENVIPANDVSGIVEALENREHSDNDERFDKENFDSYVSEIINCKESFEKAGNVAEKLSEVQIREYSDEIISRLQAIENAINDGFIKQTDYEHHIKDAKYCIDILNAAVNIVNTVNTLVEPVELRSPKNPEDNEWLVGTSVDRAKSGKKKITKKKK